MLCSVCQKKTETTCSLCKIISYCSRDCQKSDWKSHKKCCNSFIIQKEEEEKDGLKWTRRSIIAAKDLERGDRILEEFPLFHISRVPTKLRLSKPELPKKDYLLCVTCGTNLSGFQSERCSKCKWPVCVEFGKNCEKHKIHAENECGILASRKITYESLAVHEDRLVLLILRVGAVKEKNPDLWDDLMKRADEITNAGQDSKINREEISKLENVMKKLSIPEEITQVYKKFFSLMNLTAIYKDIYAHRLNLYGVKGIQTQVGDFLSPLANYFSHSCAPNCNFAVEDYPTFKIHVRAARPIRKGEELTIHHLLANLFEGTIERRLNIQERFGFFCKCERCSDPTEFGMFFSGIVCDVCRPQGKIQVEQDLGYFLPLAPESKESTTTITTTESEGEKEDPPLVQCIRCKTTRPYSSFEELLSRARRDLEKECGVYPGSTESPKLEIPQEAERMKNTVAKYSGKILHPNHFLVGRAHSYVCTLYGQVLTLQSPSFDEIIQCKPFYEGCVHFATICGALWTRVLNGSFTERQAYGKSTIAPALLNLARIQALSHQYKTNQLEGLAIGEKLKESLKAFDTAIDFHTKFMPTTFKPLFCMDVFLKEKENAEDMLRQFNNMFTIS